MATVQRLIERESAASVRYLLDVTGTRFNLEVAGALREYAARSRPFFCASAVVGLSGLHQVLYRTITPLLGHTMQICATRKDALDWLAVQPNGLDG